jgi:CHAT domain-containing protein/Tfp pilus assembly protein PilF
VSDRRSLLLSALLLAPMALAESPVVLELAPQGAASASGLRSGDELLAWSAPAGATASERNDIADVWDALALLSQRSGHAPVILHVRRAGVAQEIELSAAHWGFEPAPARDTSDPAWSAMRASESSYRARDFEASRAQLATALAASRDPRVATVMWERRVALALDRFDPATATDAAAKIPDARPADADTARALRRRLLLGDAALLRRDLARARSEFEAALELAAQTAPHAALAVDVRRGLTATALERRDLKEAGIQVNAGLAQCTGDCIGSRAQAELMRALGSVRSLSGDDAGARAAWEQSLEIATRIAPDSVLQARMLSSVGLAEWREGRLAEAETYIQRALAIATRDAPGSLLEAGMLNNIGIINHLRFDYASTRRAYERAAEIFASVAPTSPETARALTNVALAAGLGGDAQGALRTLERVLAIQQGNGTGPSDIAYTYHAMGLNQERLERLDAAAGSYRKAIELREGQGIGGMALANSQQGLAAVLREQGRYDEAAERHQNALHVYDRVAPSGYERAEALYGLGIIARERNKLEAAADYLGRAVEVIELQEQLIGGRQDVRASYAARFAHFYKDYLDVLMRLGREPAAFETLERYRARLFRAMLSERNVLLERRLSPQLRAERLRLDGEVERTSEALRRIGDPLAQQSEVDRLLAKLGTLQDERSAFITRVRAAAPALAAVRYPAPFRIEQADIAQPQDTVIVSFAVTAEHLYAFLLEPPPPAAGAATRLSSVTLPLSEHRVRELLEAWRVLLASPHATPESSVALNRRGQELYDALLAPLGERLTRYRRWLVVPDGPLHLVPLNALVTRIDTDGMPHYVIEDHSIAIALSLSLLTAESAPAARTAGVELVAFGDPLMAEGASASLAATPAVLMRSSGAGPLPWSREEVAALGGLFGADARVYLGGQVTERRVLEELPGARRIHFATHAVADAGSPLDSYLVLAPPAAGSAETEGRLRAEEIFEHLELDADLVALSACASAIGTESAGEGLLGLTRAFHFAGAREVLSSLWPVADRSTSELMIEFYRHLRTGLPADEALRRAQLAIIAQARDGSGIARWLDRVRGRDTDSQRALPFHWAGFQVSESRRAPAAVTNAMAAQ